MFTIELFTNVPPHEVTIIIQHYISYLILLTFKKMFAIL